MTVAAERIAQLRTIMAECGIDAYVIPMADFHQSEYVEEKKLNDDLRKTANWDLNKDFQCGTGHGFGYLGSIHEPPTGFRWYIVPSKNEHHQFEPGMMVTDEPGIYEEGEFGIRIENNLLTVKGEKNKYGQFMHFETLNFVPIDLDGIDPEELTRAEREWLNEYHKECFEKLSPYMNDEELEWLKEYTRGI